MSLEQLRIQEKLKSTFLSPVGKVTMIFSNTRPKKKKISIFGLIFLLIIYHLSKTKDYVTIICVT